MHAHTGAPPRAGTPRLRPVVSTRQQRVRPRRPWLPDGVHLRQDALLLAVATSHRPADHPPHRRRHGALFSASRGVVFFHGVVSRAFVWGPYSLSCGCRVSLERGRWRWRRTRPRKPPRSRPATPGPRSWRCCGAPASSRSIAASIWSRPCCRWPSSSSSSSSGGTTPATARPPPSPRPSRQPHPSSRYALPGPSQLPVVHWQRSRP